MLIEIPNYLELMDETIHIFDVGEILKEVHLSHGKKIRNALKGKIHQSLYYSWLKNQSPIFQEGNKTLPKY